jgi:proteic killer suppression protein
MIGTFKDSHLARFYWDDQIHKKIPADLRTRLYRRLQMLDIAQTERDLRHPPGNHYEKLSGNLGGWCSIRVNEQWRLIFEWDEARSMASNIYLDNHSYR